MPLYEYTPEFAALVSAGTKRQTIRKKRCPRPKPGQLAFNYRVGQASRRDHLGSPIITEVHNLLIDRSGVLVFNAFEFIAMVITDRHDLDQFAQDDGFDNWDTLLDWIKNYGGLPFEGDLIKWQ